MSTTEAPTSYDIDGTTVTMPVEVRDAAAGFATYLVKRKAVEALIPDDGVRPVGALPGRTLMSLGLVDYRDNDLGAYHEIAVLFFVRPRKAGGGTALPHLLRDLKAGTLGTYIWQLPVDQSFTMHAGRRIWGFPKWLADIHVAGEDPELDEGEPADPRRWRGRLSLDGQHVLTLDVPRGGKRAMPAATSSTYTVIDGAWHRTELTQEAREMGLRLGGARIQLGRHPIANTLRSLGLPKRAIGTLWIDRLHSTFQAPQRLV
ncbi:MAG TPA: acetoacetate decarboxylase family protein [Nitriliruptorales bacterium]